MSLTTTTTSTSSTIASGWYIYPNTNVPSTTDYYTHGYGKIQCSDIEIDGITLSDILRKQQYLQVPSGLNLDHETVREAYKRWSQAIEELKLAHEQLLMIKSLAQK